MRAGIRSTVDRRRGAARARAGRAVDGGRRPAPARSRTDATYVVPAVGDKRFTVAALDLGIKGMTPRRMAERGIEVHVLPADVDVRRGRSRSSPTASSCPTVPATRPPPTTPSALLKQVLEREMPYFGICFGNQIFGRALGLGTYKLEYGHRGINQPVQDLTTGKVEITAHNHGFAVDAPLEGDVRRRRTAGPRSRHVCLNDEVVEGLALLDAARLQRPVPPGGGGRPARCGLPLRPIRRPDGLDRLDQQGGCLMPKRERHQSRHGHRLRPDRHRPGLRVRLLRHPGVPRAPRGGHPRHPGQLQPGDDHDRPGVRRRDLHRADHAGVRREGHRQGASRRAARDPRWPDRAQRRDPAARGGRAREVRRRADRRRRSRRSRRARTASPSRQVVATLPPEWGAESANSVICHTMDECLAGVEGLGGYPSSSVRRSRWAGPARASPTTRRTCTASPARASRLSPTTEVLLEESILGWKEYELEVMRDTADNVVIVCSIENFDPMGVHTGDSITVAPAMTLTDVEYQRLRDISIGDHPRGRRRHRRLQHPVRGQPRRRPHRRDRDEPAGLAVVARSRRRRPASRSRRSPPRSRSATRSTRSPTTSPRRRRRRSSRRSTTSWSRCRGSRSRSSRPPTPP